MRSTALENVMEHSYMTSVIAYTLAVITNIRYGGGFDAEKAALLAIFHDAPEVFTGDLPSPIKYFDPDIYEAYSNMEVFAADKLLGILPDDVRQSFSGVLKPDQETNEWKTVKAADRIAAYLKCAEELKSGNREFEKAYEEIENDIKKEKMPAVKDFMDEYAPAFFMTLDQIGQKVLKDKPGSYAE